MKLEPVKKYKKPKYPHEEEVRENKKLLIQPLDKWKKIGITSATLLSLLMKLDESYAATMQVQPSDFHEIIQVDGIAIAPLEHRFTQKILGDSTRKVIENISLVDQLTEYGENITTSEFGNIIEAFFDWLLIQGIM